LIAAALVHGAVTLRNLIERQSEVEHLAGIDLGALWKLSWFLRDFGYDTELLGRGEIDDKALVDLWGVVKIGHSVVRGVSALNLESFSPAAS
jgi:hypothetical protein